MKLPLIDLHTHRVPTDDAILAIVNMPLETPCPEDGLFSYGIHPWDVNVEFVGSENAFSLLEKRLKIPSVIALGEVGLDKMHPDFSLQQSIFERQIALSEHCQKPLIIHNVRSDNEIIASFKRHKPTQPWILHGYNGALQDAQRLIKLGLYLSLGDAILHPQRKISRALKGLPLEHLFFETDTSETPIAEIYQHASSLLKMSSEDLKKQIFANFAHCFKTQIHD